LLEFFFIRIQIDNELLNGIATENDETDSDHSEVREIVFSTPISPPRRTEAMLPPPLRPVTPEVGRKRIITLIYRTPEKPRGALILPTHLLPWFLVRHHLLLQHQPHLPNYFVARLQQGSMEGNDG
jgi:hypothetical protein